MRILRHVPIEQLPEVWPSVRQWVGHANEKLHKDLGPEEVYFTLRQNLATLYVLPDGAGMLLLQLQTEPSGARTLWVWLAAGRLEPWQKEIHLDLEAIARELGCNKLAMRSSRDWRRVQDGYWKQVSVVYEHDLREQYQYAAPERAA